MHVVYHVLAVHDPSGRVMASLTPHGWVLPTFAARDDLPSERLFALASETVAVPTAPRCVARPHIERAAASADVLVVVDVISPDADETRLVPIAELLSRAPLLRYQAGALRLIEPEARRETRSAFLEPHWIHAVATWVAGLTGHSVDELAVSAEIHRAEEQRAVVTFRAPSGALHFKGCSQGPLVEALVTQFIAERVGGLVVQTRAYDAGRGWWLTDHVDGVPLDGSFWPTHFAASDGWLSLQQAVQPFHADLAAMGVTRLEPRDLGAAVDAALASVAADTPMTLSPERVRDLVEQVLASRLVLEVPPLVLHFDAAPRNLLWNGTRVTFLDLETLCIGPGAIAGELMRRRMQGALSPAQGQRLMVHATMAALRAVGRPELASELPLVPAVADLCLLAHRHNQLFGLDGTGADAETRRYTWSYVASDFFGRLSSWPSPSRKPRANAWRD